MRVVEYSFNWFTLATYSYGDKVMDIFLGTIHKACLFYGPESTALGD